MLPDPRLVVADLGGRTDGLVLRRDLVAHGVSRDRVRRALQRGDLVEVRPGVLSTVPLPPVGRRAQALVAHVRAACLAVGPPVAARGRTAALLHGLDLLVDPVLLELVVPHDRARTRPLRGVDVRRTRLPLPVEPVAATSRRAPVRAVSPLAVVHGMAHERPRTEAVVVLDSVRRAGLLPPVALRHEATEGLLADARCRPVVLRSDHLSGSVLETVARCLFLDAGLHGFVTQLVVRDRAGIVLARVDFAWPASRLVVEVDGARWHTDPAKDRWRDAALLGAGWRVLRFTWSDVVDRPADVVAAVRACLA